MKIDYTANINLTWITKPDVAVARVEIVPEKETAFTSVDNGDGTHTFSVGPGPTHYAITLLVGPDGVHTLSGSIFHSVTTTHVGFKHEAHHAFTYEDVIAKVREEMGASTPTGNPALLRTVHVSILRCCAGRMQSSAGLADRIPALPYAGVVSACEYLRLHGLLVWCTSMWSASAAGRDYLADLDDHARPSADSIRDATTVGKPRGLDHPIVVAAAHLRTQQEVARLRARLTEMYDRHERQIDANEHGCEERITSAQRFADETITNLRDDVTRLVCTLLYISADEAEPYVDPLEHVEEALIEAKRHTDRAEEIAGLSLDSQHETDATIADLRSKLYSLVGVVLGLIPDGPGRYCDGATGTVVALAYGDTLSTYVDKAIGEARALRAHRRNGGGDMGYIDLEKVTAYDSTRDDPACKDAAVGALLYAITDKVHNAPVRIRDSLSEAKRSVVVHMLRRSFARNSTFSWWASHFARDLCADFDLSFDDCVAEAKDKS